MYYILIIWDEDYIDETFFIPGFGIGQQISEKKINNRRTEENTQSLAQSLISSNKSKAKFQNWLKKKQTHENCGIQDTEQNNRSQDDAVYNSNRYADNYYIDEPYRDHKGSGSVNVLRVPSSRSPQFATPDPNWNSDDETGEITAAQLLSPDDFDARADDIIGFSVFLS